jgi:hypothetical protein
MYTNSDPETTIMVTRKGQRRNIMPKRCRELYEDTDGVVLVDQKSEYYRIGWWKYVFLFVLNIAAHGEGIQIWG